MWTMVEYVAEHEVSRSALGFFISGPLLRLAGAASERAETLLSAILRRLPEKQVTEDRMGSDGIEEAAGNLTAWLYVKLAEQGAWSRIARWADDLVRGGHYLWPLLGSLRGAFFFRYRDGAGAEEAAMQDRAQTVLGSIVASAVSAINTAEPELQNGGRSEAERKPMQMLYISGERLLHQCCAQLYFGSGAFRRSPGGDDAALLDLRGKRRFLSDYQSILDQIGQNGSARTLHHLIELYAHLVEAAPEAVFDLVAAILVGPGAEEGYQFEILASGTLVTLIRRYLADHREVFQDQDRRHRLISVLEMFSAAGWPEPLKLLYELPDLLR
jgi:hypothetical protein